MNTHKQTIDFPIKFSKTASKLSPKILGFLKKISMDIQNPQNFFTIQDYPRMSLIEEIGKWIRYYQEINQWRRVVQV